MPPYKKKSKFVEKLSSFYGRVVLCTVLSPFRKISPHFYTKAFRFLRGHNRHLNHLVSEQSNKIKSLRGYRQRPLFIDCGVNEGFVLSRYIEKLPDDFDFIGFEIQDNLVDMAQKNNPKAAIYHRAVSDSDGETEIYLPKTFGMNFRGGASIISSKISPKNLHQVLKCSTIRFSDFLSQKIVEQKYDFVVIKMDIEGAEYKVIDDLYNTWKETGSRLIDYLMVEFHPKTITNGETQTAYENKLDEMGIEYSTWL